MNDTRFGWRDVRFPFIRPKEKDQIIDAENRYSIMV